jgi:hypothetical protein
MHFEILTMQATAPGAAGAAAAANTGDSLTVKNGKGKIFVMAGWASRQVAGFSQLVVPSGHDTTRNYRAGCPIGTGLLSMPMDMRMPIDAQEVIAETIAGSATAGDIELDSLLMFYEDFPGINMKTMTPDSVESKVEKFVTIESSIGAVATGQYSEEAINVDSDLLKANRDYAVIGMTSRTAAHALTLKAPDFGNIRIGVPGAIKPEIANQFFFLLSRVHGKPLVPVFNSGNKTQVSIGFCADENASATLVTVYVALLK